ncbi:BglII/BstYI family type II restriction endonuclease [Curtobacterium sp. AB451]|uniref:BglII/BstYI family type II restriction endonuclease n=1 Tax=Curtobacterium sp. AB451 TaxID=3422306 RepID=UPI003D327BF3
MQLTKSFNSVLPADVLERYEWRETRNASAVLNSTNPEAFKEVVDVIRDFELTSGMLLLPGRNESLVPQYLNDSFRTLGWREARVDSSIRNTLVVFPYSGAGESSVRRIDSEIVEFEGYKADWVKRTESGDRGIAGDTEWNAKDGNLDRNVASYRALYEAGFIDGAILITRTQEDLRKLELELINEFDQATDSHAATTLRTTTDVVLEVRQRLAKLREKGQNVSRLGTSTTTNLPKLEQRMKRGDGGGCPILSIGISRATWDGRAFH